ncbi:low molecular weight phosphotyrosine protein phosphatase [Dokdonia sinensis]|uniref:protein-tyrosine-phosphatase n=1 Tax=Dokdonia sinensis TaxID=2479847 RepID=A0A3M0G6I3_9FLAO|nr:low molecular weight protein-tyrosine-phosphatase [Dokdonia sinensis]RMB60484.1 low molecular weight phosphotyrosine protein phosphatase [Dokdonia sinensis]
MEKTKILMVCLGNICRSTLAEGILKNKLEADFFEVDSAGTGDWHVGDPPDHRSIRIGRDHSIDISRQRGRQIKPEDLDLFDHILVMDRSNYKNVMAMASTDEQKDKIRMILDAVFPNENVEVPDPYHGNLTDFENVYQMLDEACNAIAQELTS